MGMYTAISLGVELNIKQDSPVAKLLNYMVDGCDLGPDLTPEEKEEANMSHIFFATDRWHWMLNCDSYYFDYQTHFSFTWDHISKNYYLSGVSNLKNYSGEIEAFLDWLNPFIHDSCGFIGWTMYEEDWMTTVLMRRRLKKDADLPDIIRMNVEQLVTLTMDADTCIEQLMPGAYATTCDIGFLNETLMALSALKKEVG